MDAKQVGVADRPGVLRFTSHLDTTNHVVPEGVDYHDAVEVPVTTLDELISCDKPTFLKLDVEGLERQVLLGAAQTLASEDLQAVVMEINESGTRYGADGDTLISVLRSCSFEPFEYLPFSRELRAVSGKSSLSANTIFVKDRDWTEKRIKNAHTFGIYSVSI